MIDDGTATRDAGPDTDGMTFEISRRSVLAVGAALAAGLAIRLATAPSTDSGPTGGTNGSAQPPAGQH